ncbi:MAG: hypothetical protein DCC49_12295 [Acidobacteria bacterium]|nr:MAG: hypothetical protein DCC49_12295 [Acidobacteriota bacterium]
MPEETGEPQPHGTDDTDTLAAPESEKGKPHWSVGAVGEGKFREPTLRELADRGELFSVAHLVWVVLAVLLIAGVSFADRATTPYVLVAPGAVQDLAGEIEFEGEGVPSVSSAGGEIALVTVATSQATYADHFYARVRSDLTLIPMEKSRPPGVSDADERRRDEAMMLSSQEIAEYVALRHLGYPATYTGDGALVEDVSTDTAAPGRIKPGDIIKSVDGRAIKVNADIRESLGSKAIGDEVTIGLEREGAMVEVALPLSASSDGQKRPVIGVVVTTVNPRVETPFEVKFRVDNIGGPSGGLAFALEIIDSLSAGDLTKGRKIVATGAISPNGAISPIGGVYQKAIAASRAGADYFLVPSENYREVGGSVGNTRIIPVNSLDSALQFLNGLSDSPEAESAKGSGAPGRFGDVTAVIAP